MTELIRTVFCVRSHCKYSLNIGVITVVLEKIALLEYVFCFVDLIIVLTLISPYVLLHPDGTFTI